MSSALAEFLRGISADPDDATADGLRHGKSPRQIAQGPEASPRRSEKSGPGAAKAGQNTGSDGAKTEGKGGLRGDCAI